MDFSANYSNCSVYGWPPGDPERYFGFGYSRRGEVTITKVNLVTDQRCLDAYGSWIQKKICVENLEPETNPCAVMLLDKTILNKRPKSSKINQIKNWTKIIKLEQNR